MHERRVDDDEENENVLDEWRQARQRTEEFEDQGTASDNEIEEFLNDEQPAPEWTTTTGEQEETCLCGGRLRELLGRLFTPQLLRELEDGLQRVAARGDWLRSEPEHSVP